MDAGRDRAFAVIGGVLRGVSLSLGVFALVSLAARLRGAGDANTWWIDASVLHDWIECPLIAMAGLCLIAWGIRPRVGLIRRFVSMVVLGIVITIVISNVMVFYRLLAAGTIRSSLPVPVSLLVCVLLVIVLWYVAWPKKEPRPFLASSAGLLAGIIVFAVFFPLAQIILFGQTDYRRPADAIVVLGARTYADGSPSQALADRVRTACSLYDAGLARLVIMSGGPGDGTTHETQAMQKLAMDLGVPARAILRDNGGTNTAATMRNLATIARRDHIRRVIAVSHAWHLPRIKLASSRTPTLAVYTVPCRETYPLTATPFYMAREIPAFWKIYLSEVLGM